MANLRARSSVLVVVLALAAAGCERRAPPPAEVTPAAPPSSAPASVAEPAPPPPPAAASSGAHVAASAPRAVRIPPATTAVADAPPAPAGSAHAGFPGPVDRARDAEWAQRMLRAPIAAVKHNGGGKSLTLRVTFVDGRRAVVKARQKASFSNHRAEIAAFHLDRLLGFGRTAVVVGRRLPLALLRSAAENDPALLARMDAELVPDDREPETIECAMIAWHEGPLVDASPPSSWKSGPPTARVGAYSDLVLFDAILDNTDRWSGGNVLSLAKDGPLVFLDNASALLPYRARQHAFLSKTLDGLCTFRRPTIDALRVGKLADRLGASLAKDPLAPVVDPATLGAIDERVAKVLSHVDACSPPIWAP